MLARCLAPYVESVSVQCLNASSPSKNKNLRDTSSAYNSPICSYEFIANSDKKKIKTCSLKRTRREDTTLGVSLKCHSYCESKDMGAVIGF